MEPTKSVKRTATFSVEATGPSTSRHGERIGETREFVLRAAVDERKAGSDGQAAQGHVEGATVGRPAFDLASPGLKEAWERGDRDQFLVDTINEPIRHNEGKHIGIKR